jgi:hypothetical protein
VRGRKEKMVGMGHPTRGRFAGMTEKERRIINEVGGLD